MFLKELSELAGVSGYEYEVRNYLKSKLEEMNCDFFTDKLGNIIAHNKGKSKDKKILLTAHMDEIGLIVTGFNPEGGLSFKLVGQVNAKSIITKVVEIGENKIAGVIGTKHVPLMTKEQRETTPKISDLYIDIGCISQEEAIKYVKIGDYATFKSLYLEFGNNQVKGKALSSRVACSTMLKILNDKQDIDFYVAFTVMSCVGARGAYSASYVIDPDLCIILSGTVATDTPNISKHELSARLGDGPVISLVDKTLVYNEKVIEVAKDVAQKSNIPYQLKKSIKENSDAEVINSIKTGIDVLALSIPCRYLNTPANVINKNDYIDTYNLIKAILQNQN